MGIDRRLFCFLRFAATGTCDPYAVVQINHREEFRTKTVENSREPNWDDSTEIQLNPDFKNMDVIVWNSNGAATKDAPVGKVSFSREYLAGRGSAAFEQWFPLSSAKTEGSVSGEVNVELTYDPPKTPDGLHKLTVSVLSARGLVSKDTNGFSDPYMVLHVFPDMEVASTQHTKVVLKSLNPKYHETFTLYAYAAVGRRVCSLCRALSIASSRVTLRTACSTSAAGTGTALAATTLWAILPSTWPSCRTRARLASGTFSSPRLRRKRARTTVSRPPRIF